MGPIVYLYVGTEDVDADIRFLVDGLGGELAWRYHEFGGDVAGVRMGDGPSMVLRNPAGNEVGLLRQSRPGALEHP